MTRGLCTTLTLFVCFQMSINYTVSYSNIYYRVFLLRRDNYSLLCNGVILYSYSGSVPAARSLPVLHKGRRCNGFTVDFVTLEAQHSLNKKGSSSERPVLHFHLLSTGVTITSVCVRRNVTASSSRPVCPVKQQDAQTEVT